MLRHLVFALSFSVSMQAYARDVHVFYVGDDQDPDIGQDVSADITGFQVTMSSQFGFSADLLKRRDTTDMFRSRTAFLNRIKSELRGKVRPDDAVLFYYSGHGEARNNKHGFLVNGRRDFIERNEVLSAIKQFSPSLTVLISDSCAKKNGPVRQAGTIPTGLAPIKPLMRRLFLEATGVVDMNSCTIGESAWQLTELDDFGDRKLGGLFTKSMLNVFRENENRTVGWDYIWSQTYARTVKSFKTNYPGGAEDEFTAQWQNAQRPQKYALQVSYRIGKNGNPGQGNPGMNRQLQNAGRVSLGLSLRTCDEGVHIDSVRKGSPATRVRDVTTGEKLMLEAGDHILSVNGVAVDGHEAVVRLVNQTDRFLRLTVKCKRTNSVYRFQTELRN